MNFNIKILDKNNMIVTNNKLKTIKLYSIVMLVLLVIGIFGIKNIDISGIIIIIPLLLIIFFILVLDSLLQGKNIISIENDKIYLYKKYGKNEPEIINSKDILYYEFSHLKTNSGPDNNIYIKYNDNKIFNIGIYDDGEANIINNFFIEYCKNKNINHR